MYVSYVDLFNTKRRQVIEELNEILIMLTVYHFFCFTDFVQDVSTRTKYVGLSMVGITLLNMAVNLIPILYDSSINLKKKFKRRYNKMSRYMRERENKERRIKRQRKAKY